MISVIRSAIGSVASLGFIKFLKENDIRVVGTDLNPYSAAYKFVDQFYTVPKAEFECAMIEKYLEIIKETKSIAILSGPETEIISLAKYKKEIAGCNCVLFHPDIDVLRIITDKWNVYNRFSKIIDIPRTDLFSNYQVSNLNSQNVILKPKEGRGSSGIYYCDSINKMEAFSELVDSSQYIIQEVIKGEEYTVDTLHDPEGELLNTVVRKRLKTDSGISIVGETVKEEKIFEIIEVISKELKFYGGNCFQFIENNGNYYLTDINPRFGGGSILSLRASSDFQNNLVNLLSGKFEKLKYHSKNYESLKMYRYYEEVFE